MEISHGAVRVAKYKVPNEVIQYVSRDDTQLASWSYSWKCLMTAMRELAKGLTWRVGNGEMVSGMRNGLGALWLMRTSSLMGCDLLVSRFAIFLGCVYFFFYSSSGLCLSNCCLFHGIVILR